MLQPLYNLIKTYSSPNDDWQEDVRRWLYPRLHVLLRRIDVSIPGDQHLFATGVSAPAQYAGRYNCSPEEMEEILWDLGFVRNPLACYKHLEDGRQSVGSWVLRAEDDTHGLPLRWDEQLHITLYKPLTSYQVDVYAHTEADYLDKPLVHLKGETVDAQMGVELTMELLDGHVDQPRGTGGAPSPGSALPTYGEYK